MRDVLHDSTTATSELTNRRRNEDRSEIMATTNKERGLLDYVPTTNNNTENMTQSITTNVRHSRDRGRRFKRILEKERRYAMEREIE
jgi:hypothetical protein